ncbi:M48 family metallopeptidase [Pseudomonadota bacterium]
MLSVSGIDVEIVRKDIKNLHLAVYPPNGHVRVAVPKHVTDDNVRLAIISRLSWIKKQQKAFAVQPRQSERLYVSGECHYYFGKRYRLELIERMGKHEIVLLKSGKLKMFVRPNTSVVNKEKLLDEWYRAALKKRVPELIEKWQPIIGEELADWGIRKMKTKWGSCNTACSRIWLNLELAKKPTECIEYILVHEMVHLLERGHNDTFRVYMDRFLPQWQSLREVLNRGSLGHQNWEY